MVRCHVPDADSLARAVVCQVVVKRSRVGIRFPFLNMANIRNNLGLNQGGRSHHCLPTLILQSNTQNAEKDWLFAS